jgi:hypothetical protein
MKIEFALSMSFTRLLLVLAVLAAGYWLVTRAGLVGETHDVAPASQSPIERAREGARKTEARNAQTEAASRDVDAAVSGGSVTEGMTPEQVRALLGSPDAVESAATETGVAREKWMYRKVGKTVVFENGVAVRID